jgi:cob(I)alamin adenosyltransferase
MVNLSRIYTRTGDAGNTRLSDFSETAKTDPRVQAYGHVDEANSILGVALTQPGLPADIAAVLRHIQNELFDCGADLSNPLKSDPEVEPLRITNAYVDRLESWCDYYSADLPDLRSFILPGGSPGAAWLQFARSVVRRAERTAWAAASVYGVREATEGRPGGVNLVAITYLNRLSDLLFILGRASDRGSEEVLWVPGKDRQPPDPQAHRQRTRISQAAKQETGTGEPFQDDPSDAQPAEPGLHSPETGADLNAEGLNAERSVIDDQHGTDSALSNDAHPSSDAAGSSTGRTDAGTSEIVHADQPATDAPPNEAAVPKRSIAKKKRRK